MTDRWLAVLAVGAALGCGSESMGAADGGMEAAGATVDGTLTLPGAPADAPYVVRLYEAAGDPAAVPVGEASGRTAGSNTVEYVVEDVPAGDFFLLGFVDVDGSGGTASTPGDYAGWYGHSGDGNPPSTANVSVPGSGTVTFDVDLVER